MFSNYQIYRKCQLIKTINTTKNIQEAAKWIVSYTKDLSKSKSYFHMSKYLGLQNTKFSYFLDSLQIPLTI